MHKIVQIISRKEKEWANPSREHKKEDKFFVCPECDKVYETWRESGSRWATLRQQFNPGFPRTGLKYIICEECKTKGVK